MSRRPATLVAAAAIIAASGLLVRDHTRNDSFSSDEPIHILAGYLQVSGRTAIVNIEHPPLMKTLAGLAVAALPVPRAPVAVPLGMEFNDFGHRFLFSGPVSPDRIAAFARAPFLLLFSLLLAVLFLAARHRYGDAPALFALALVAFDPNFVAHAGIVHTDVAAALVFLSAVLAWDAALRRPTPGRLGVTALVFGIALATKFSTVYLLPIFAIQGLLTIRRDPRPGPAAARMLARLAAICLGAILVLLLVYAPVTSRMDPAQQRGVIHGMVAERGAPRLSRWIEGLVPVSRPLAHYLGGLASVARQNVEGGGVNYLLGRTSVHGFPSYFLFAYLCKSTLAFLAVAAIVLVGLARDPKARAESVLLLTPVLVLFLVAAGASYNIGVRHLLPVYPFLALAAAGVLARMSANHGRRAALLLFGLLPLASAAELARVHPHELSYFNPFAGGPIGGRRILSDSNVDWGLDLKRLAIELRRRGVERPTVCYFGGDDVPFRVGVPDFAADPVVRGPLVAISAFQLAVGPDFYAYHGAPLVARAVETLRRTLVARGRLVGRVGYSIDLYEIPRRGAPR